MCCTISHIQRVSNRVGREYCKRWQSMHSLSYGGAKWNKKEQSAKLQINPKQRNAHTIRHFSDCFSLAAHLLCANSRALISSLSLYWSFCELSLSTQFKQKKKDRIKRSGISLGKMFWFVFRQSTRAIDSTYYGVLNWWQNKRKYNQVKETKTQ